MSATFDRAKAFVDSLRDRLPQSVRKQLQDTGLLAWRGEFHYGESYRPGDVVRSNSRLWVCLIANSQFPSESRMWEPMALGAESMRAAEAQPNIIRAETADKDGNVSALHVTTCWGVLPDVAVLDDYDTGVSLTINGSSAGVTIGNGVAVGNCVTYDVTPAIQPDDVVVFFIDNTSGHWTYRDEPLSDIQQPVTNLFRRPIVQSAQSNTNGTEVTVSFDIAVNDDGGSGPYTGDAQLQADGSDLTITGVSGNGTRTLTYTVQQQIYQGQTLEWTANGISFSGTC